MDSNPDTSKFRYPALKIRQSAGSSPLILFAAPATEINDWAGVPQKARVPKDESEGTELIGFQRDDDDTRVGQIAQFYAEPSNVIQNPLLCAIRRAQGLDVAFEPDSVSAKEQSDAVSGHIVIATIDLTKLALVDLLRMLREYLETRVPDLKGRPRPEKAKARLRQLLNGTSEAQESFDQLSADEVESEGESGNDEGESSRPIEDALFDQSHIAEFWEEIAAREDLLNDLGKQFVGDAFLGFSREAIEAYLRPIILVDGQHRLRGALQAARAALDADAGRWDRMQEKMVAGLTPGAVQKLLETEHARRLPISLLMNERADEHVFQFVVVNQKATPVRAALLGTIISTSLADEELERIATRLESAGIQLQRSVSVTFFAKNAQSPFAGRVARGFANDSAELLPWSVLGQLVNLFRHLKGGKYFHSPPKIDYADLWKRQLLPKSGICEDWQATDADDAYKYWQMADGPWRDVFIVFWTEVRDRLADVNDPAAPNYWGNPRSSNLFNKPTLLTLATDFFAFLTEARKEIESAEAVHGLVQDWLYYVDKTYFARDWHLAGVKKDSPGTRKQWSMLWYDYRRDAKTLPKIASYKLLYKG